MLWLSQLFRRTKQDAQLDSELRFHIEQQTADNIAGGMTPDEARRRALAQFGGLEYIKEETRDARSTQFIESLLQDIRFALRMLRKSPGFTIVAILTLALGIGANTAIFSMVNGVIVRTLPYRQPQQLYVVNENVPQWTSQSPWGPWFLVNPANFLLWQGHCPAISSMALIEILSFNMTGQGIPRQVNLARVSANFFSLMGIRPQFGRDFLPEEDQLGRDHEVILSAQFWRKAFNSNPEIVGKSITLEGSSYVVVGITPDSFRFPELPHQENYPPEIFKPIGFQRWEYWSGLGGFNFDVIARLKPGASPDQALAQLNVIEARIAQKGDSHRGAAPGQFNLEATLRPLKTVILGQARRALWMLMIAAFFVLLIICLNLANLVLVKNVARTHEVAVRSALGASKWRLIRQSFVEGLILATIGGSLGLLFARVGLAVLIRNAPFGIPRVGDIHIDLGVLFFTAGVALATAILFGLLPTSAFAKISPLEALNPGGRIASGNLQSARLRTGLVVSQIALCGVLLAGALLLIQSLVHVERANQWMDEQRVLALDLSIPPKESNSVQHADEFLSNVLSRVRMLPGVQSAGFTSKLPLEGQSFGDDIDFEEVPHARNEVREGEFRFISPGYFQTIGLPLVGGRFLSESDRNKNVVLISERVANTYLRNRNPIGMHLMFGEDGPAKPEEIIGVVGDVRNASDQLAVTAVYIPLWTYYQLGETLVVRTAMDPSGASGAIRRAIWSVDPEVAIPEERSLRTVVESSEAIRRYESFLAAIFAAFAVFLASLGLYGVISYSISQRTHEIGIRMALGAQQGDVVRLIVGQGTKIALLGVGISVLAALGLTRLIASLLFGVTATDPLTYLAVALLLFVVTLAACYMPARRAMKVDPMVALRYE